MALTIKKTLTSIVLLSIAGCGTYHPVQVTEHELNQRVESDVASMHKNQENISNSITLHEATARALQYNLDYKLKLLEETLYQKNLELSNFDMLPKLLASAGYRDRNNDYGSSSLNLATNTYNYSYSTSQDRSNRTAGVSFSWNVLDFGISYYKSKQQANQFLIAEERRRKVIQNIMQDVRASYYRALAAQKLTKKCDDLLTHVTKALEASVTIESRGLASPSQTLTYQRTLLETTNILVQKRRELELAKLELSALMNVPSGTEFTLADEPLVDPMPTPVDMYGMERTALMKRPELREEDYKNRISADDAKRLILGALPSIGLDASFQYDSNKYLYKNNWLDYGARASWDLTRLLAVPSMLELNNYQGDVNNVRRAALTMAVITQVRLSAQRYDMALFDYDLASRANNVEEKLMKHALAGMKVGTENDLEVIRVRTKALFAEIQKYASYSDVQTAYARMINSLGLDLIPASSGVKNIQQMTEYMSKNEKSWDNAMRYFLTKTEPIQPAKHIQGID